MPRTEAGKRLISWLDYHRATGLALPPNDEAAVDAIEDAAVAAALDALAAEVAGLKSQHDDDNVSGWYFDGWNDASAAVLAAIEKARP